MSTDRIPRTRGKRSWHTRVTVEVIPSVVKTDMWFAGVQVVAISTIPVDCRLPLPLVGKQSPSKVVKVGSLRSTLSPMQKFHMNASKSVVMLQYE